MGTKFVFWIICFFISSHFLAVDGMSSSPSVKLEKTLLRKKTKLVKKGKRKVKRKLALYERNPQPRRTVPFLKKQMDGHLLRIESFCEGGKNKDLGQKSVRNFYVFLQEEIRDPHMDGDVKTLFRIIIDILKENVESNAFSAEAFRNQYMLALNLQERISLAEYPHAWAMQIENGLRCIERLKE